MTGTTTLTCATLLAITGCTVFDERLPPKPDCYTNQECSTELGEPAVCVETGTTEEPAASCVRLLSEDCTTLTGDHLDDNAVVIASLFSTTGAQAATNIPRQQSAIMAVEAINESNASGGILMSTSPGDTKKLVMISCDEIANLPRVATHLISELRLPAIVGPNLSQDTIDVTLGNEAIGLPSSARSGTLLITPAAVANAIANLPDNGLTFQMVPTDVQRVPLMKAQINALETLLKTQRMVTTIKLGIFYRDDALGKGTSDALTTLTINGGTLAAAIQRGEVRVDPYDPALAADHPLVATYANTFQPDIIVIVGTAEAVKYFMVPLEAQWPTSLRPHYVTIDSLKVPDLINAVKASTVGLRTRVRGTGVLTPLESVPIFTSFQVQYGQRWKDAMGNPQPATISSMGPSYDAVFAVALSLVGQTTVTGDTIAQGLTRLATNPQTCMYDGAGFIESPCYAITDYSRTLYRNMTQLLANEPVTEIGTFGRLEWDNTGAKASGLIEMWCIDGRGTNPIFASSGLTYDVKTQQTSGVYTQCPP